MILSHFFDIKNNIPARSENIIGITSGCFDLMHPLHIMYLQRCRRKCTDLIVLIDSDDLVQKNKQKLPIFNEMDRAFTVDALGCVQHVLIMDNLDILKYTLGSIRANYDDVILFRNANSVYGSPTIEVEGVKIELVPDVNRLHSTTEIINHIKNK